MSDLIRSASLLHFSDVARSVGLNPEDMLRTVGLPPAALSDPDIRIPSGSVRRLLEAAAATGIEDFGLRLAERGGLANLGPVALAVREQATVGEALEALSRYIHIHNEAVTLQIDLRDGHAALVPRLLLGGPVPARQSVELVVGVAHRILQALLGPGWRPLEVHFTHPAPRNRDRYRRFFGCTVAFSATHDAILLPLSDLERATPAADARLARYARDYVEAIAARSSDFEGKVRELVMALMPTGRCTVERVAEHLGCDRRTVHRHLLTRGTSFSRVVDDYRAELVVRLLDDTARSLPAVAELLGFSAQSALARWFKERFGCTISQWRASARV